MKSAFIGAAALMYSQALAAEAVDGARALDNIDSNEGGAVEMRGAHAPAGAPALSVGDNPWGGYNRLDAASFQSTVLDDDDHVWAVAFVNPLCKSCRELASAWGPLTARHSDGARRVRFGYVDALTEGGKEIIAGGTGNA
jgi:hypothetical protein